MGGETAAAGWASPLPFTSQGVPFLHGGEEVARTKFGNGNSYNAPDSINETDWSPKKRNYDLSSLAEPVPRPACVSNSATDTSRNTGRLCKRSSRGLAFAYPSC